MGGCCTVDVDILYACAQKTVGLQGRPGLDSNFPLRSLFWREKKKVVWRSREGRKEGRKGGMMREEEHLVIICVH